METFKVKLKDLDSCLKDYEVEKRSDNYWKVFVKYDYDRSSQKQFIGFRTYYKKYFGSNETVNIRKHKKFTNIYQMFSDKGMHMMDIFDDWVQAWVTELEPEIEPEEKVVPVILTNLLEKWDELINFKGDEND